MQTPSIEHIAVSNNRLRYSNVAYISPFRIFYNQTRDRYSPEILEFNESAIVPDYIVQQLALFRQAFSLFIERCGFHNPLEHGNYFKSGVCFIDVLIDDIPVQKGFVAATPIDNSDYFSNQPLMQKPAVKITLHRALISGSATPIHELFHVFQYSYCWFNNPWFMEGLARWSQTLTTERQARPVSLPSTNEELEELVSLAHDAEYFWRKLEALLAGDGFFIKRLLAYCAEEAENVQKQFASVGGYIENSWTRIEKRSSRNNRFLFAAIRKAVVDSTDSASEELLAFTSTLEKHRNAEDLALSSEPIQRLFHALARCGVAVAKNKNGLLECAHFDLNSGTLFADCIISGWDEDDWSEFDALECIEGRLTIEESSVRSISGFNQLKGVRELVVHGLSNLESITGFNGLEQIRSLLIERNPELRWLNGFSRLFYINPEITGYLKIVYNKNLESVAFLHGIRSVGSSCYLHHNSLSSLTGLDRLEEVGASLSLSSNRLESLTPLAKLRQVKGMLGVAFNQLQSLNGLELLRSVSVVNWSGQYRSLALQGNPKLSDLRAIGNLKSDTGHLVVCLDRFANYNFPARDACMLDQSIEFLDGNKAIAHERVLGFSYPNRRKKILFSNNWVNNLKEIPGIEPFFFEFSNAKKVIDYAKRRGVRYIYGQFYRSQKFIYENKEALRSSGLRFIVNPLDMMQTAVNKRCFFEFMMENGFSDFIPRYFYASDEVKYPCVVKPSFGSAGRDVRIVHDGDELGDLDEGEVVSEYVAGEKEYASNLFYKDGNILLDFTYEKYSGEEFFLLSGENKSRVVDRLIENPFRDIFCNILKNLLPNGGEVLCCFDYKIVNGVPKIFEINARLGLTLVRHKNDFSQMMDCYIREADSFVG